MQRLARILAVAAAAVLLTGPALAQTSLDDPLDDRSAKRLDRMEKVVRELRAIVFQGRETGQPVVVQPADTDSRLATLNDQLSDLQQTLQRVNGGQDTITHTLEQQRQDIVALRQDNAALKARLDALEQKLAALTAPPPPPPGADGSAPAVGGPAPPADDAAASFAAAKKMLMDGDYASAEAGFRDFTDRYPDGPRALEAQYYLAKTLLARRAFQEAATADVIAVRGWPQTAWAPDATLDLARALIGIRNPDKACQILDQLSVNYPKAGGDIRTRAAALRAQAKCS